MESLLAVLGRRLEGRDDDADGDGAFGFLVVAGARRLPATGAMDVLLVFCLVI